MSETQATRSLWISFLFSARSPESLDSSQFWTAPFIRRFWRRHPPMLTITRVSANRFRASWKLRRVTDTVLDTAPGEQAQVGQ
jgi:hypothetical protein